MPMKILLVETIVKTINWVKVLFTYFNHIFAELEAKDTPAIVKITFHLTFLTKEDIHYPHY